MRFCENCQVDVSMVTEITPDGLIESCPTCHFKPRPLAEDEAPRVALTVTGKPVGLAPAAPGTLVEQVRARLAIVETEIERLAALKTEQRQLRAMLKAAERKR